MNDGAAHHRHDPAEELPPFMERKKDTRSKLLDAAAQLVKQKGAESLTLDATARAAGVSKGGLLYHFPTKDALIEGLLRAMGEQFDTLIDHYLELEPPAPGRWLRAYINATFDDTPLNLDVANLLLGSIAANPYLLRVVQEMYARWEAAALSDGLSRARAWVVRMAVDNYWADAAIHPAQFADPDDRRDLIEELMRLTHP